MDKNNLMSSKFRIILYSFLVFGSLYFLFIGLTSAKSFLIPLIAAIILSMVINPVARRLKRWGVKWGIAVFLSDFIIVLVIGVVVFLLAVQASQVAEDWPQIEKRLRPKVEQVESFLNDKLNIQVSLPLGREGADQDQNNPQQNQTQQNGDQSMLLNGDQSMLLNRSVLIITNVFGFLGNMLLILVYVFFFTLYQKKFADTLVGIMKGEKKEQARTIIKKSAELAQQYLFGRFILILILAGLYGAGYSIVGLKYAVFISLTAAVFSLVPYIGNLLGLLLAVFMLFLTSGVILAQLIGVLAVYIISQFLESYILEPFIIGQRVDLNPVVIIVGVVAGGAVWGIMGMLLAIPIIGILKVVFDNIETLKPLGYGLDARGLYSGESKVGKLKSRIIGKIKSIRQKGI
ncbi:MAG: AI-2E family transporter [Spirochaetia bacterium]